MKFEVIETIIGKHRRVEIRKHGHLISEITYTLYDPDKEKTLSAAFSRLDDAYSAARMYADK